MIVEDITADTDLRTSIAFSGRIDLIPDDLAQQVQAVLREAVSNAVRHAHATSLAVTMAVGADVVVEVTDNGDDVPDTVAPSGPHNLANRAAAARGACTIDRPPGGGTRLVWAAPLQ